MAKDGRVLYCHCAHSQIVPERVKDQVLRGLSGSGVRFDAVADLCEMSARKDPLLKDIADARNVTVLACYRRAVKWLFHAAGAALGEQGVEIINMRTESAETILASLLDENESKLTDVAKHAKIVPPKADDWVPWFPIIDYDRCTNCRQCLNFCLFGVYESSAEGKVHVANPENCKTNCPACARVCPEIAIIFPKYKSGPICGDRVDRLDETTKAELSSMVEQDVHAMLRERSKAGGRRFSPGGSKIGKEGSR